MEKYKIIAICGKAGAGKDTLAKGLAAAYPNDFHTIVSHTTRPRRENEQDGVDYHFISIEAFTKHLLDGEFLEATAFNDWHYGTLKSSLDVTKPNVGIFNPEGLYCLLEDSSIDLTIIYVVCSDKERLIRQLNREENPDIEEIIRRFKVDNFDFDGLEEEVSPIVFENKTIEDKARFIELVKQLC